MPEQQMGATTQSNGQMQCELATIGAILGGVSAAKTIFGGKDKPQVKPPTPMPMADDAAVEAAKRRKQIEIQSRSGRASTILSDSGGDKLGG